jgi:hypothetical protein
MDFDLDDPPAPLTRLLDTAEDSGCVNLSELDTIARRLGVPDDELCQLHESFEARGIDVTDDCGRSNVPPTTEYSNGGLAVATTDELGDGVGPERARRFLEQLAPGTVACGHGEELEGLFGRMRKGEAWLVEPGALRPLERLSALAAA